MTDQTARDVLAQHRPVHDPHGHINGTVPGSVAVYDCYCGGFVNATLRDCLDHQWWALQHAGFAVVPLPEPAEQSELYDTHFDVASDDEFGARTPRVCVDRAAGELYFICVPTSHITPREALSLAAGLVAAVSSLQEKP